MLSSCGMENCALTTTTTTRVSNKAFNKQQLQKLSFWFAPTTRPPGLVSATSGSLDVLKSGYSESLVLDSEKGELVKAQPRPVKSGKKGVSEEKAMAALKNHSEAERRRRERINANLDTLRGLVPSSEKMDKATLLAEVISQVKILKKTATEASKGTLIPTDSDEVTVEPYDNGAGNETLSFQASLCCDNKPELLTDLKQALDTLQLNIVKAEMSTLEGRLKSVFIFTTHDNKGHATNAEACKILASSVHQALKSVVDKASYFSEYSPRMTLPSKRRRVSYLESLSSSS